MSSTIAKALKLLDFFSDDEPEIGVSELSRRSGLDKAAIHRMFAGMMDSGLIEQNSKSRLYRLGPAVLRLATIRQNAFPMDAIIKSHLRPLSAATDETAHAQLISGLTLATIGSVESSRSSRVSLMMGEVNPMHSTAAGLVTLAYCAPALCKRVLERKLEKRTSFTETDAEAIAAHVAVAFEQGYTEADQTYYDDVYGLAAPIFGDDRLAIGAIAVAAPSHRVTPRVRSKILNAVLPTAVKVTEETGGLFPDGFMARIQKSLDQSSNALEVAS